ncbi:MAG: DotI/IcmL family type IV secretion protein [Bdellovibrionales bacterium]
MKTPVKNKAKEIKPQQDAPQPAADETAQPAPTAASKKESALFKAIEFVAFGHFLYEKNSADDVRDDESGYLVKHRRILNLLVRQCYVVIFLIIVVIAVEPYLHPIKRYRAILSDTTRKEIPLVPLYEPNLTDSAVLSWVESSITEILTFGFGDFDRMILSQKYRFTDDGWISFVQSLVKQNMREDFKMRQLVLTTAPADAPVIVSKGLDADLDYVWTVEMPIIMTYTTNNNVRMGDTKIVRLMVARVPAVKNVRGIGIKQWEML